MGLTTRNAMLASLGIALLIVLIVTISVSVSYSKDAPEKATCPASYLDQVPFIVVSMDGFKATYKTRGLTPMLDRLGSEGVTVPYMKPSFPTITFPNHYTIVTGLYPESHGIIANKFYDPDFGQVFSLSDPTSKDGKWWGGEPIWNTLTLQGKKSATYFWPGSDANITGMYPTYYFPYNSSVPFEDRVDQVLEWVLLPPEERPALITLYFNEPDHTGHESGPDSAEVDEQLVRMNGLIDQLVTGLEEAALLDCVNLVLLADHGMAGGGESWVIRLQEYIPNIYDEAFVYGGGFTRIEPKDDSDAVKYAMMRNLSQVRPDMRVYEREGLPSRYHFSNNRRIEDIVLDFDAGRYGSISSSHFNLGNHGYDNYFSSMNALFVARGPAFLQGHIGLPFQNIHLYELMCHLTGVQPAPNNGTVGALNHLLVNPITIPDLPQGAPVTDAVFPDNDTISQRLDVSGCAGDLTTVEPWLYNLSFSEQEMADLQVEHLPWGTPLFNSNNSADLTLLYQNDHITGYSEILKQSLWTSFTLMSTYKGSATHSWISDVRLTPQSAPQCNDFEMKNLTLAPLFPPRFSKYDTAEEVAYLISNTAPSTDQQQVRWNELMGQLVPRWLGNSQLNVVVGPVYDNNADSLKDDYTNMVAQQPVMPSDWFAIVTKCSSGGNIDFCNPEYLTSRAFVFPTHQEVSNGLESERYALEFSSTVRDVERLTGFMFYPDLPQQERIRLEAVVHPELFNE